MTERLPFKGGPLKNPPLFKVPNCPQKRIQTSQLPINNNDNNIHAHGNIKMRRFQPQQP